MEKHTEGQYKEKRYFNSTRNYTLALLQAFSEVKYWVDDEKDIQKEFKVPLTFGNYEKSITLEDKGESEVTKLNFNFLPRLVLSFEGLSKIADRQTNKFNKLTKRVIKEGSASLDVSYNSVAYDFHYTLLLQARGLTIASQVTEEILSHFNPSLNLLIKEFPIFPEKTETQIIIGDPAFEILDEFTEVDTNIINVTFDITVRGNIYSQIELQAPVKIVDIFTHIWDKASIEDSKLASFFHFDISPETHKVVKSTTRIFDGTVPYADSVKDPEDSVIKNRKDYSKYQIEEPKTPKDEK